LKAEVPYWSEIERMTLRRAPLPAYAPRSDGAGVYTSLWSEVEVKMNQAAFTRAVPLSIATPERPVASSSAPPAAPRPEVGFANPR
jgi:hypothetical protein